MPIPVVPDTLPLMVMVCSLPRTRSPGSDKSIGADLVRDFVFTDTNITISSDQQAEFSLDVTSNSGKPLYPDTLPLMVMVCSLPRTRSPPP